MSKTESKTEKRKANRSAIAVLAILLLIGCSIAERIQLDRLYGVPQVRPRLIQPGPDEARQTALWNLAKPVLASRCVVCHSCYDAPCQLKLTSAAGIDRGASKEALYGSFRLGEIDPIRLHIDAPDTAEWRRLGFFPVLNERGQTPEANRAGSLLYQMLKLKQDNPLPVAPVLPAEITVGLDRSQQCPQIEQFDTFRRFYPDWGMPYGVPNLHDTEFNALVAWIESGAFVPKQPPLAADVAANVAQWENFLNNDSLKQQLVSRYLYEHLFLGDLYFNQLNSDDTFKLVRSKTPPGQEISIIPTRRPYDPPGVDRVYYRLMLNQDTLVAKTHMAYALNSKRIARFKKLFYTPSYRVNSLPSYDPSVAANPFTAFKDLPPLGRYNFMLDDAQFFVMGFIKGPVCQGRTALNVIDDQFWVFFEAPEKDLIAQDSGFLDSHSGLLRLPTEEGSSGSILSWNHYAKMHAELIAAKQNFVMKRHNGLSWLTLDTIWDGEQQNTNAALTVFRHDDSASVVRGLVGLPPKTAWVIDFSLFERVHYLLVAGFDVFGSLGHQALTRMYMDFLRIEGENTFLSFLPPETRIEQNQLWYRGLGAGSLAHQWENSVFASDPPGITYTTDNPKLELFDRLAAKFGPALAATFDLPSSTPPPLAELTRIKGTTLSTMPEVSLLRVARPGGKDSVYTILRNRAYLNVAMIALDNFRLAPAEDTLTVAPGIIGSYPTAFFSVPESELSEFSALVGGLSTEQTYLVLRNLYGIRRTNPQFWNHSDWFQNQMYKNADGGSEILDYSRLENR